MIELQRIPVFENGRMVERVWVAVQNGAVIDRPNHPRSVEAAREWVGKQFPEENVTVHPHCQPKKQKGKKK